MKKYRQKEKEKIILALIWSMHKDSPDHILFGINHMQKISQEMGFSCIVKRKILKSSESKVDRFMSYIKILFLVLFTKHDILYYTIDPSPLILVSFLKKIKLYNKKMFAWKYVALSKSKNKVSNIIKKILYDSFNTIFMMTENHVEKSIASGLISSERCIYMKWGEDTDYIDRLPELEKNKKFTFISSGRAYRDFDTLCSAFSGIENAILKIYTKEKWGGQNYQEILDRYKNPNIQVCYSNQINKGIYSTTLDYLFAQMKAADCAVIICKDVNFGVGYTNILDSMVSSIPVIATGNKDNPIDIDAEGIGTTVMAGDAKTLHETMAMYVNNRSMAKQKGLIGRALIDKEYNIKRVTRDILKVMFR